MLSRQPEPVGARTVGVHVPGRRMRGVWCVWGVEARQHARERTLAGSVRAQWCAWCRVVRVRKMSQPGCVWAPYAVRRQLAEGML